MCNQELDAIVHDQFLLRDCIVQCSVLYFVQANRGLVQRTSTLRGEGGIGIVDKNGQGERGVRATEDGWMSTFDQPL